MFSNKILFELFPFFIFKTSNMPSKVKLEFWDTMNWFEKNKQMKEFLHNSDHNNLI